MDSRFLCFMLGFCSSLLGTGANRPGGNPLTKVFQWSQLEFDYASPEDRQAAIDSGAFAPGSPVPIDVDVYYGGPSPKVFVTIPRFQSGVPVALGVVSEREENGNRIITPYPNWEWQNNPEQCNEHRIVSAYRVKIDECGRLWVLDTGRYLSRRVCPPQILAFDLRTDELVHKYEIPDSQLESHSILVTPIIDVRDPGTCQDTFVYAADCQANAIIVHDVKRATSWKVVDKTMYPYPQFGTFSIQGDSFDLMDGVLGMDISPFRPGQDRRLYFHAMSSPTENWVLTSHLRNHTLFEHDPSPNPSIFHTYNGWRSSQSAAEGMDKEGIMYFGTMSDTSINCWNSANDYDQRNIGVVAQNPETLQFASGVKVLPNKQGQDELWFLTCRFQKFAVGRLVPTEINFRIQAGKTKDLIKKSKCRNKSPHYGNNGGPGGAGGIGGAGGSGGSYGSSGSRPSYGGSFGNYGDRGAYGIATYGTQGNRGQANAPITNNDNTGNVGADVANTGTQGHQASGSFGASGNARAAVGRRHAHGPNPGNGAERHERNYRQTGYRYSDDVDVQKRAADKIFFPSD